MRARILTMSGLWAIVGIAIGCGGMIGGQILLLLTAMGVLWELVALLPHLKIKLNTFAMIFSLALCLGGHFWGFASAGTSLALILILATHWKEPPATLCAALVALIIVGTGLGSLNALAQLPSHQAMWWVIWVIATIKLSDAGAYLFGSIFGRHPLAPNISPGKTIEGFLGALLSGVIMGIVGAPLFLNLWFAPVLGVVLALVGSIGDLLESVLKRYAGVKDSGHVLPGIGGLLDLCDSLILAAPVAYLCIRYFVQ